MEKWLVLRLKTILLQNLQEYYQSAYRELHSTKIALLRVRTDLQMAMDDRTAVSVLWPLFDKALMLLLLINTE